MNFDTSEENRLSILLSFHESHNQVEYWYKIKFFVNFYTTFFEIIFVTFISYKSLQYTLRCQLNE